MKVLLLQQVDKIGRKGEIVDVSPGFAKNSLLPKKQAVMATADMIASYQSAQLKSKKLEEEREQAIKKILKDLEAHTFSFSVETGKNGEVFTSLHPDQIQNAVGTFLSSHDTILSIDDVHIATKPLKLLGEVSIMAKIGRGTRTQEVKLRIEIHGSEQ